MVGRVREADFASVATIRTVVKTVEAETHAVLTEADAAVAVALAIRFGLVADRT